MSEAGRIIAALPEERLHEWVLEQRWFASKAREVAQLNVLEAVTLREDAPLLVLALVEARFQTGTHELYQVPFGMRPAAAGWDERVIAVVDGWTVEVRPIGVEQSNSSIVFGEELILKVFRRLEAGVNPELELLRFLSEREFPYIAPLAGWY